jgi:hypothetical protein
MFTDLKTIHTYCDSMKDYIINSFMFKNNNSLFFIYNYIKMRYDKNIEIKYVKTILLNLIKKGIVFYYNQNQNYGLTHEGLVVLNDHKYYYSKIIINFFKKYKKYDDKKYELKEIRKEQQSMRTFLINNKPQMCIICDKTLPLCLLETAHIKPRCILNYTEIIDNHVVELMCRYCHSLYDNGFLSVNNGLLCVSSIMDNYGLQYNSNKIISSYNLHNEKYFNFHYKYIYRK